MAVECTAYCPFCHSCTCCLQVFLELFPSGPWLFGYSSKYPSDSLIRNLARSSCAWPVDGGVMLLPLTDNAPNGAYWKIQKLWNTSVANSIPISCFATIWLRRSWDSSLLLPIIRCLLCGTLVTKKKPFIAHQYILTQLTLISTD